MTKLNTKYLSKNKSEDRVCGKCLIIIFFGKKNSEDQIHATYLPVLGGPEKLNLFKKLTTF